MGNSQVVQFRSPDELIEWLDKQAEARRMDRSVVIRDLLWAAKDAEEAKQKRRRPRKASKR